MYLYLCICLCIFPQHAHTNKAINAPGHVDAANGGGTRNQFGNCDHIHTYTRIHTYVLCWESGKQRVRERQRQRKVTEDSRKRVTETDRQRERTEREQREKQEIEDRQRDRERDRERQREQQRDISIFCWIAPSYTNRQNYIQLSIHIYIYMYICSHSSRKNVQINTHRNALKYIHEDMYT